MKNSLGTLAAVAALATASSADAVVVLSSLSNVDISSNYGVDIDGNEQIDFVINSGSSLISGVNPNMILVNGAASTTMLPLSEGSLINGGSNYSNSTFADFSLFTNDINGSIAYAGFAFQRDSNTHYAWLEFSFSDNTFTNATLVRGAWENVTGTGITAGAIPEPSQYALLGGVLALGFSAVIRRRRR